MQSADIQLRLEQQLVLIDQALQDAISGGSLSETERMAVLFDAQERIIVLLKRLEADESGGDTDDECCDECDEEFPDPIRSALDALRWMSAVADFQPGGWAHASWCEICQPAIEQLEALLEECVECCEEPIDEEPA